MLKGDFAQRVVVAFMIAILCLFVFPFHWSIRYYSMIGIFLCIAIFTAVVKIQTFGQMSVIEINRFSYLVALLIDIFTFIALLVPGVVMAKAGPFWSAIFFYLAFYYALARNTAFISLGNLCMRIRYIHQESYFKSAIGVFVSNFIITLPMGITAAEASGVLSRISFTDQLMDISLLVIFVDFAYMLFSPGKRRLSEKLLGSCSTKV